MPDFPRMSKEPRAPLKRLRGARCVFATAFERKTGLAGEALREAAASAWRREGRLRPLDMLKERIAAEGF